MYIDWTTKPLSDLFMYERRRVADFIESHAGEFTFCLIEHLATPDAWNEMRDFVATFTDHIEGIWERLPAHLREDLRTHLDQHQAERTSLILGLKLGMNIREKSERCRNRTYEEHSLARLSEQLKLTTDEALGYAIEGSSSDELTALLKVLPIARASILSTRVSDSQINSAAALLDAPVFNIDAIVEAWIQRLKSAAEKIGRSRRDFKRIAKRMLESQD